MKNVFRIIANKISAWTGSAAAFLGAIVIVAVWATTGPIFHYSDTWQLVINTGTTIVTFLMVFLIQNTQNRDGKAVQLKLDELIRATKGARSQYVGLEDLIDEDLAELDKEFKLLVQKPGTIRAINKLHDKIRAERALRMERAKSLGSVLHLLHLPGGDSATDQPKTPPTL
jgi:low affinity Fe/Cu permease